MQKSAATAFSFILENSHGGETLSLQSLGMLSFIIHGKQCEQTPLGRTPRSVIAMNIYSAKPQA